MQPHDWWLNDIFGDSIVAITLWYSMYNRKARQQRVCTHRLSLHWDYEDFSLNWEFHIDFTANLQTFTIQLRIHPSQITNMIWSFSSHRRATTARRLNIDQQPFFSLSRWNTFFYADAATEMTTKNHSKK